MTLVVTNTHLSTLHKLFQLHWVWEPGCASQYCNWANQVLGINSWRQQSSLCHHVQKALWPTLCLGLKQMGHEHDQSRPPNAIG